jgi:WD40 repeat protein
MHVPIRLFAPLATALVCVSSAAGQDRVSREIVSYERDVKPIIRKRCATCHNTERPRGELDLTSFSGVMAGGAGGKVAVSGHSDESPIYTHTAHLEDPKMPPNAPRIPQCEIDLIRVWIDGGLLERTGDAVATPNSSTAGAAALVSPTISPRASAISALAAHPSAPIVAVSGNNQVLLFDLSARKIKGALPYPEGDIFRLRFSKDGRVLLAAGGTGAELGRVALFRTDEWSRLATLGDELDVILGADLRGDLSRIAIGGPARVVKVLANPGGKVLFTLRKPTDWVTTLAFSPDGLLLAAGDRFGGLFLWEAQTGELFLSPKGHARALTSLAWNAPGDRLWTAAEDGVIQVLNLHTGKSEQRWDAHAGGVLAIDLHDSGRIASVGRDRRLKVWSLEGKPLGEFSRMNDAVSRVAWASDGRSIVTGDFAGQVRVWSLADGSFVKLPMPVAESRQVAVFVKPDLAPARVYSPKVPAGAAPAARGGSPGLAGGDDPAAALANARQAAAAAERTVAILSKLSQSQGTATAIDSAEIALGAARDARVALKTAIEADSGNSALAKALEETERAIKLLEEKNKRALNRSVSQAGAK